MDQTLLSQYLAAGPKLREGIAGLSAEELRAFPIPGTWSIQQIILHLMDADLIWTSRLKLIIAEDNPTLLGYDETRFAKNLFYDEQSADDAITIVDLNRRQFARILVKLPDSAFDRTGHHNERGPIRLGSCIELCNQHVDHHLKFLYAKRQKLGK